MNNSLVLRANGLSKRFGTGSTAVLAVDDVSLEISKGEFVLIMGPSGSGKTTLLSMLGGLLRPSSGNIHLGDLEIASLPESQLPDVRARRLGFIFQAFNLLDALTVEENILLPTQLVSKSSAEARKRLEELLERLDLGRRRRAHPATLSGGEKQRVAIARALINRAPLVLADEPTGNLDSQKGQEVTMILHDIARDEGCSIVVVTHDPRIEEVADRILWLEDGRLRDRISEVHSWVRDPVCGMRVDEWTATFATEHASQRYVFCSRRCLERFVAAPSDYVEKESPTPGTGSREKPKQEVRHV